MTRETIMDALLAKLVTATAFKTTGRRLVHWTQVAEQPALFLRNVAEQHMSRPTRLPGKVLMDCEAWLYSHAGQNPDTAPSIGINDLIDAVQAVLNPSPAEEAQTLGGLVIHCWIEGRLDIYPGDLDGQAIAVVPVKMLVPTFGG